MGYCSLILANIMIPLSTNTSQSAHFFPCYPPHVTSTSKYLNIKGQPRRTQTRRLRLIKHLRIDRYFKLLVRTWKELMPCLDTRPRALIKRFEL
ncbi:hypothetical protein EVAR_51152_1 [Eumeta japonica]|uniref:Uncharacterized protein n=1 Tax=Eumeta variegata TaxID=151549 RepID=A0A4C1YQI2_EUMVA|nr:hypothetical protein EVAR_51152_1 [Eumeta japonica]